jgi:hypothetical protein
MDKCPKCGSTAGFTYYLLLKTERTGDWGNDDDEEVDCERVYDPKTVECVDCHKRIKWDDAHGLNEDKTSRTLTGK